MNNKLRSIRLQFALMITAFTVFVTFPAYGQNEGWTFGWLKHRVQWNKPGAPIPINTRRFDKACNNLRNPKTREEAQLAKAGWYFPKERNVDHSTSRGNTIVVDAAADDGRYCGEDPDTQLFVFVNGAFAGTLAPMVMDNEDEGDAFDVEFKTDKELVVSYLHFGDEKINPNCTVTPHMSCVLLELKFEIQQTPALAIIKTAKLVSTGPDESPVPAAPKGR